MHYCSDELEQDWKQKFLKMEWHCSVAPGQRGPPLEVGHFDWKIST